jgi:protein-S-isoprenylcysteine O-methyltransferase
MIITTATWLGLFYILSEVALGIKKRANASEVRVADSGSLRLLWIVIVISIVIAYSIPSQLPGASINAGAWLGYLGVVLFVLGLALRWYAIVHLGRFFTVNVAIAADHRLIDTGPYRYVRHPSYTGALLAFLGLALCLRNWASMLVMLVPIAAVFVRRMRIEEAALTQAFGEQYRTYMNRTKRLIPAIY